MSAAFTPTRDPQVTAVMHELGTLTLTTTDQYYVFMWVAICVISFIPATAKHSPFPRWFGYFNLWIGLSFTPDDIWLEEDGTLFAVAAGWTRTIRTGFESS